MVNKEIFFLLYTLLITLRQSGLIEYYRPTMFIINVSEKANKSLNKLENFCTNNGWKCSGFDAITVSSCLNWLYFNGRFVLPLDS